MKDEWVALCRCESLMGSDGIATVEAAVKCRRVVQVRRDPTGDLWFFARVPLPKAILAHLEADRG